VSAAESAPRVWTVLDVLRWTAQRFSERGVGSPRLDAELLIAHALALPRIGVYTQSERPLSADELERLRELVRRRQGGESVAYLTGRKEFYGIALTVDARVLVPRPDTETLVEEALARIAARAEGAAPARIADVGTGSGAVALALAKHVPGAQVFAVDVSPDALAVASANAEALALAVTLLEGDLAAPLSAHAPFDLIVANLPYVPAGDIAGLAAEVRAEPRLALDGGADGLDLVRRLCVAAPPLLAPGGALALEIGAGQADATAALLAAAGFSDVTRRRDLGGVERVVAGVRGGA